MTIASGVPGGAMMPYQPSSCRLKPCSERMGTSGSSGPRADPVMATGTILPALIMASGERASIIATMTSPLNSAVSIWPMPR
ncbi:hypothetical protein D3C78_1693830 [compost metagenome]